VCGVEEAVKYLSKDPIVFGANPQAAARKTVEEFGGPAAEIPDSDRCVSGKHNRRLTECLCEIFLSGKAFK
jgi:hypothetical protein